MKVTFVEEWEADLKVAVVEEYRAEMLIAVVDPWRADCKVAQVDEWRADKRVANVDEWRENTQPNAFGSSLDYGYVSGYSGSGRTDVTSIVGCYIFVIVAFFLGRLYAGDNASIPFAVLFGFFDYRHTRCP